ncbi:MAG: carbohydrate-binding family 9-like protein [Chloroflexota bacterium]
MVPAAPAAWSNVSNPKKWAWDAVPTLPPFICADGKQTAVYATTTRVCADRHRLYVRFDCEDNDIWGNYTQRDEPIYDEEVVELFLAPSADAPTHYYEFEVSPNGVLFDAKISNATPNRADIIVQSEWDCEGIEWWAERCDAGNWWTAVLIIPWTAVAPLGSFPTVWRANFYRIERPRGQEPEYSCWSPTYTEPADFHKPQHFGYLHLEPSEMPSFRKDGISLLK